MPYLENYHPDVMSFGFKTRKSIVVSGINAKLVHTLANISAGIPRTDSLGVSYVMGEDGIIHQKQYVDLDGDGDVDADWWYRDKCYNVYELEVHDRFMEEGQSERGRIVRTADSNANYILSGVNYSGSQTKDLVIGRYNGPSNAYTQWQKYDKTTGRSTLNALTISTPSVPANASSTGTAGQIEWDSGYIYVCVATNTWKRAALSTW
jgi:hypothetical protein